MKKTYYMIVALAASLFAASCSDVPNPYELVTSDPSAGKSIPYKSTSLSSGFNVQTITGNAWSQGSSYTQASGWTSSTSTAVESESWLVSPGINTADCDSAVVAFDYTIRYGNGLSETDIADFHCVYASADYTDDVTTANWVKLPFQAEKSSYSDWTTYPSNDIQIPDSLMKTGKIHIAFVYKCGNTQQKITTWELMNFSIRKGTASIGGGSEIQEGNLPYSSSNLQTGWTTYCKTEGNPWSQGSSYTQATGYQKWNGSDTKSNQEVEGFLLSPAINTHVTSGKVKFAFDNTIRYTNNVANWQTYHKIYVSDNYNGHDFNHATWTQIAWTPTASPYTDWTLYTSGEIQLPEAFVNKDNVTIAFYFYAPASGSTTWELMNFKMEEGEASGGNTPEPPTPSNDCNMDFTSGQGGWNIVDVEKGSLSYVWQQSSSYGMKASAFVSGSNVAAESWLISPSVEIGKQATLTIENALNFLNGNTLTDHIGVYVSTNYTEGNPSTAQWTAVSINNPASGSSWDWVTSTIDLSAYKGKKVTVAFKYVSTSSCAPTWEIKNVSLGESTGGGTGGGTDTPSTGAGSKDDPYSCNAAIAAGATNSTAWVKGYIVGYVSGTSIASGAKFGIPEQAETEVLIADSPDETDYKQCIPVQLPSGAVRTGLELFAHQNYYKKSVTLYGQLTTYFGVLGVKSTSCAIIEGTTIGTEPTN